MPAVDESATRRAAEAMARFARPVSPRTVWALSAVAIALPTLWLATSAIQAIYARVGHPGAALDDTFIHFQYARAIAEGHPFRYEAGEPATMGATSVLWPVLLAPFHYCGLHGWDLIWVAWGVSFAALGLLAREAYALTEPLAGREAGAGAAAMVLSFSAFTWCAGTGMEIVPFAWCLTRAVRRSSEWAEGPERRPARARELVLLAFIAPLLRPEGALASVVIAAAFGLYGRGRGRSLGLLALVGAVTPQLLSRLVIGAFRSNATAVKLMPGNPYFVGRVLREAIFGNVNLFLRVLLNGEMWSAEFLPHGSAPYLGLGFLAILILALRQRKMFRGVATALMAVAITVPCAYITFLWNRLRYLWPFAPFWIVGMACLCGALGEGVGLVLPRARRAVTFTLAAAIAALLATKLSTTIDDLAMSASGIDRQQVALGHWAKETLPRGARIGVNDTGAIAYFSEHPTFDIVGLTTPDEGRYWVAGAASRFEHYENLWKSDPARLPAYFIVYPEWMALNEVLGPELGEAIVTDANILGGQRMVAYEADYSALGSGDLPWTDTTGKAGEIVDSLDVADLESEGSHAYGLLGARDGEEIVSEGFSTSGKTVVDGGRRERRREAFHAHLGDGVVVGIVRLEASEATTVRVVADNVEVDHFSVEPGDWSEATFHVAHKDPDVAIVLTPESGALTTYHYWFARAL